MRRFSAIASAAVLLVGSTCSILGAIAWASYVRVQATRNFEVSASSTADALSDALQRNTDLSLTARVLVETEPTIGSSEFADWFHLLEAHHAYPGSFGLLYIARVAASQLGAFELRIREQPPFGAPATGPFHVMPPGSKAPYCLTSAGVVGLQSGRLGISASALTPLLTLAADDLDFCALQFGGLLRASAQSGRPAAATLASLLAAMPRTPGARAVPRSLLEGLDRDGLITTITPVYARTASDATSRTAALRGWVIEVFEARTVFAPILDDHKHFSAVLSFTNPSGRRVVLDRTGRSALATTGARSGESARTFGLAGPGPWAVTLAEPPTGTPAATQGIVVLLVGLLISILLFAVVRLLIRARRNAFHLVDQRTAELEHQALHDALTGLPNRAAMFERVEAALARARTGDTDVAVVVIDLDKFSDVNDRFGHHAGDLVLSQVAARFQAVAGNLATLGRLGGDDFLVVLEDGASLEDAEVLARSLLAVLRYPFRTGRTTASPTVALSASLGIAVGARVTAETLVSDAGIASIACFEARVTDARYLVFRPEMRAAVRRRIETEAELRESLAQDRFFFVYQPIFDLRDRRLVGVEALLRWNHPARGVVLPEEFIPALEATGMIVEVSRVLLAKACRQAALWRATSVADMYVSVNVSARQLERDDIVSWVRDALESGGLAPDALQLEITETALMHDSELSVRRLGALKGTGVKLAIDDFGTGYCSLSYLRLFPVDALKIDQTFVSSMESSHAGRSLVRTVLRMAEDLKLVTVAEGIETQSQLDMLRREGCTLGQGFLFAKPLTAAKLSDLFKGGGPYPLGMDLHGAPSPTDPARGDAALDYAVGAAVVVHPETGLSADIDGVVRVVAAADGGLGNGGVKNREELVAGTHRAAAR